MTTEQAKRPAESQQEYFGKTSEKKKDKKAEKAKDKKEKEHYSDSRSHFG